MFNKVVCLSDFVNISARISSRRLDGANVTLEQVEQTDSIVVENLHPGTTPDTLTLYFESSRGGDQRVNGVTMLSEDTAKVSFINYECKCFTARPSENYYTIIVIFNKQSLFLFQQQWTKS